MPKGYNQRNKLLRIQDIQNRFKEIYKNGMVTEYVYNNYIKPEFRIARNTFYLYLKVDVKKELIKLETDGKNKTTSQQISMDFFSK